MSNSKSKPGHNLLSSFRKDQGGGVILMFAGAALCLMMIAAGAIEMHRRNLAVAQLQNAADSAALAGKQRQLYFKAKGDTTAASQAKAINFAKGMFDQAMSQAAKSFPNGTTAHYTWNADGSFTVGSTQNYTFLLGNLMPANFKSVTVRATADFARSTPTEVAMVLDTTASMFNKDGRAETRFTLMREASKKFAQQLFDAAQTAGDPNLIRVSVVPWATTVNIKGEAPAAADFSAHSSGVLPEFGSRKWIASPLARSVDMSGTNFAPVQWRGCITGDTEAAGVYSDAAVSTFKALQTAQAPIFNVKINMGPMTTFNETTYTTCASWGSPYTCSTSPGTQGFHKLIEKAVPQIRNAGVLFDRRLKSEGAPQVDKAATCQDCLSWNTATNSVTKPVCTTPSATYTFPYCDYYSENGRRNSYLGSSMACTTKWDGACLDETGPVPTADQNRAACVGDPNEPAAINKSVPYCPVYSVYGVHQPDVYTAPQIIAGPNLNCPMPMLGLSGNRKQVIETLDRLSPVPGGTHADVGLRWGLRSLSPSNSWPTFFGLSKAPAAFGSAAQKVMLLVTDGENEEAVDYAGYWGCSRIDGDHPDCKGAPNGAELDNRMQKWCDAIRNDRQVTIYAVAVNFTNAAAVTRLQNCAGNPSYVFSVDAADLSSVLAGIANRVMAMRLTN